VVHIKNLPQHMPVLIHTPPCSFIPFAPAHTHSYHPLHICPYPSPPPMGAHPLGSFITLTRHTCICTHLYSCAPVLMWAGLGCTHLCSHVHSCVCPIWVRLVQGCGVCALTCAHCSCSCELGLGLVTLVCAHVCSYTLMCGSCLGEVGARGGVWLKEVVAKCDCGCVRGDLRSGSQIFM
jgi:hypothetical protein